MCLVGEWGTRFAASTQPILLQMVLTAKGSADTVLASFSGTVCVPPLSTWSWFHSLLQYSRRELWDDLGSGENKIFSI